MKSGQVTIKDIARELNISPSTVSRALKDHPDISTETKKNVQELAESLNYQPNTLAMGLRQNKTNTLGVIIPKLVHFFFSTVISGIEDVAYNKGYSVIISQSDEKQEREALNLKNLYNHRVDGILMSLSKDTKDYSHIEALFDKGVPLVFFDRALDNIPCSKVIVDDFDGAYKVTKHLLDQGYTRIAHLAGPEILQISRDRLRGYKKALMDHGLGIDQNLIFPEKDIENEEFAKDLAKQIINMKNRPQAIFTNNDMAAVQIMSYVKNHGLKVPEDLAIAGFSNWNFTKITDPPLTTVKQPGFEMGQKAAELLIREIESVSGTFVEPETIVLKTKLKVRKSSSKTA